jgi:hypothetical protein
MRIKLHAYLYLDVPIVTTPTLKYTAFNGDSMTIICEVFGQPEVTNVNWHITTHAGSIKFSGSWSARYDGSFLPDLRFVGITFQDAGNYTCSATNFVGTTTSQIITVKVNGGKLINTFLFVFIRHSWSYGSWIYNYLCNQCLSQLTLRFRIPNKRGVFDKTLCNKVCQ